MIGAGAVADLLHHHPNLASRFESEIRTNDRFLKAFQYVVMTGIPLAIQQRLNAAMADRGVDPKFLVEYDETYDE